MNDIINSDLCLQIGHIESLDGIHLKMYNIFGTAIIRNDMTATTIDIMMANDYPFINCQCIDISNILNKDYSQLDNNYIEYNEQELSKYIGFFMDNTVKDRRHIHTFINNIKIHLCIQNNKMFDNKNILMLNVISSTFSFIPEVNITTIPDLIKRNPIIHFNIRTPTLNAFIRPVIWYENYIILGNDTIIFHAFDIEDRYEIKQCTDELEQLQTNHSTRFIDIVDAFNTCPFFKHDIIDTGTIRSINLEEED